jgi:hypothetical protein
MKVFLVISVLFLSVISYSCASKAGDETECPKCDNKTELLVGTKCVPIEDVEDCGPDGHSHGDTCHCFSNQEVTVINGRQFCLQQDCHDDHHHDEEEHDCDDHHHDEEEHHHDEEDHHHEEEDHHHDEEEHDHE